MEIMAAATVVRTGDGMMIAVTMVVGMMIAGMDMLMDMVMDMTMTVA